MGHGFQPRRSNENCDASQDLFFVHLPKIVFMKITFQEKNPGFPSGKRRVGENSSSPSNIHDSQIPWSPRE